MRSLKQSLLISLILVIKMISESAGEGMGITYPGTKWCGPGNSAKNFDDLGENAEEDKCCRAHDHCDDLLLPGQESSARGLKNNNPFTRLSCKCDKTFKDCLKAVNSKLSNNIGNIYFSVQQTCYKLEYPVVACGDDKSQDSYKPHRRSPRHLHEIIKRVLRKISYKVELYSSHYNCNYDSKTHRPCLNYKVDTSSPKKWQFLDMPQFKDDRPHQVFQFDEESVTVSAVLH